MVLKATHRRLEVLIEGQVVNIALSPWKNTFLSVALTMWGVLLSAMFTFMVFALLRAGAAWFWLLVPALFAGTMMTYVASLLRWNNKATETVEASPTQVRCVRAFHPSGNAVHVFSREGVGFAIARSGFQKSQADSEVWGIGPWSLFVVESPERRVRVLSRLTRVDARSAAEALRTAGYVVENLDAVKS